MMPVASPTETRSFEELLETLVESDGVDRALAAGEGMRAGYGGMKVADHRCGTPRDPAVLTFAQLYRHLVRTDAAAAIKRRGFRMHTKLNVEPWNDEQPGHGPGLHRGAS